MKVRHLTLDDIPFIQEINQRCHPDDTFPTFKNFIGEIIVITDDHDHIISMGGVDLIAEAITITDNEFSSHTRAKALRELLKSMLSTCNKADQDYLHAFNSNKIHEKALIWVGFRSIKSDSFFLKVT